MDMNDLKKEARETAQAALKASVGTALVGFEAFFDDKDVPDHHKHAVATTLQSLFERLNDAAYARDVSGIAGAFSAGQPADRIATVTGDTFHAPIAAPAAPVASLSSAPTVSEAQYAKLEQAAKGWSTTVDLLIDNLPAYITAAEQKQSDLERERNEAQRKLAEEHDPAIVSASEAAATADLASVQAQLAESNVTVRRIFTEFGLNPSMVNTDDKLIDALKVAIPPAPADPAITGKAKVYDDIVVEARNRRVNVTPGMTPATLVAAIAASGGGTPGTFNPNAPELTPVREIVSSFTNGHAPAVGKKNWVVRKPDEGALKAAQKAVGLPETGYALPPVPAP